MSNSCPDPKSCYHVHQCGYLHSEAFTYRVPGLFLATGIFRALISDRISESYLFHPFFLPFEPLCFHLLNSSLLVIGRIAQQSNDIVHFVVFLCMFVLTPVDYFSRRAQKDRQVDQGWKSRKNSAFPAEKYLSTTIFTCPRQADSQ